MASRYAPQPLDTLLAGLPSMPRPILARLTARLIERLDELDGDPDLEDGNDREQIEEREVEDFDGGYANEPWSTFAPRSIGRPHVSHPDLARIHRQVRAIKRRRRS